LHSTIAMRALAHTSALLLAAAIASAQPPAAPAPPVSAAVAALQDAVSRRTPGAEADFWSRVQRGGAPLVEPIPGDTLNVLLTFVWRGDSATRNVALVNAAVARQ